jgi:hypothetical protein
MPPRVKKGKKGVAATAAAAAHPENLLIVVRYTGPTGPLTETEKKRFIRNLKKQHYYYDYLSRKFKFTFEDREEGSTEGRFIWKEGSLDNEAGERVVAMLLGDFNILPEGVAAELVETTMV